MTLVSVLSFQLQPMTYPINKNQRFYFLIHCVCTMTFHYQSGTTAWRSYLIFLQIPLCTSRDQVVPKPQVICRQPPSYYMYFIPLVLFILLSYTLLSPCIFSFLFYSYPLLFLNSRPLRGLTLFTRAFSTISFRMTA